MYKRKLNVQGNQMASVLWAEHKFSCSITGLREAEQMSMTMLVQVAQVHQQPMKTLKQQRKGY